MSFQALLVCNDEDAIEVLTSVLSGFGIVAIGCAQPQAISKLSDERFDAVIVDFDDPDNAAAVLQSATQVYSRNRAITVALLADKTKVRSVMDGGANFVLYKPVSAQQAEAGLRAAIALIKRERRRSFRVPVQAPVHLKVESGPDMEGILLDLSEEGMDVLSAQPLSPSTVIQTHFLLPDGKTEVDVRGEIAWANPNGQSGVRFLELANDLRSSLKNWVAANAPELPPLDPEPVSQCKLTDLSLGGCYVETDSPFPERAGVILCLKAEDMEVQVEGVVRVMHPGFGMGIEFPSRTEEDHERVTHFIDFLTSRPGTMPELLITPRALSANEADLEIPRAEELDDPLLELLRSHEWLSQDDFLLELRKQRGSEEVAPA